MSIKPLRDNIVCSPIEDIGRAGRIWLPDNTKRGLKQDRRMVVLYAGPLAKDDCPVGSIINASELWGDEIEHKGKKMWLGRMRDINCVLEGVALPDNRVYSD